jgi:hypothetical protein
VAGDVLGEVSAAEVDALELFEATMGGAMCIAKEAMEACLNEGGEADRCRARLREQAEVILGTTLDDFELGEFVRGAGVSAARDMLDGCRSAKAQFGDDATCGDVVAEYRRASGETPLRDPIQERREQARIKDDVAQDFLREAQSTVLEGGREHMVDNFRSFKETARQVIDTVFADLDQETRERKEARFVFEATVENFGQLFANIMKSAEATDERTPQARAAKQTKLNEALAMLQEQADQIPDLAGNAASFVRQHISNKISERAEGCGDVLAEDEKKLCRQAAIAEALDMGLLKHQLYAARDLGALRSAVRAMVLCKDAGGEEGSCKEEAVDKFKEVLGVDVVDADTETKIVKLASTMILGLPTVVKLRKALKIALRTAGVACSNDVQEEVLKRVQASSADAAAGSFSVFCQEVNGEAEYQITVEMPAATQEQLDQAVEDIHTEVSVTGRRLTSTTISDSGVDQDSEECAADDAECGKDAAMPSDGTGSTNDKAGSSGDAVAGANHNAELPGLVAASLLLSAALYV